MKLHEKLVGLSKELNSYFDGLKSRVGEIDISINQCYYPHTKIQISIGNNKILRYVDIPIEDWDKVKNEVDRLLNKETG